MDNNNEVQDFDLDDILNEFHEEPETPAESVEPDEELEALLHMPELTITPVVVHAPEGLIPEDAEDPAASASPADAQTQRFDPITDSELAEALAAVEADPAVSEADTISLSSPVEAAEEGAPTPPPAEPAFEVEEEFIPSPILFAPRSQLKKLKKQLVAGPEKRYYELSEIGTGKLQISILLNLLIVLACAGVTTLFAFDMVPENRLRLVIFSQVLAMLLSALLGSNLMIDSIGDLLKGRFTINALLTVTFAVCLVDSVFCLTELRVPCCAAFSLEMTMALWARLQRRNTEIAQLDTMRKAVRLNGIVKVENYYEGLDGLLRTDGEVSDFMDTYQKPSSPEIAQSIFSAISLLACIGIACFAGVLHGLSMAIQILATSLLVAVPASFFVSITRPMAILEARLHMVGTVLCGWDGVRDLCGKAAFPLMDQDLFPQGSTKLNGVKFYGDRTPDEVVSYTTSLMIHCGGGLVPLFQQLMAGRNGTEYPVHNFQSYSETGIGGEINGEPVLLGTLDFLQGMGIHVPEGTMVNQAIYAAIDGQLSAVYAISYAKMRSSSAGLVTLCGYRKLTTVKLCGDFMLTEDFLQSKFGVNTKRMVFPSRQECAQLYQVKPDPEEPVLALTTRDELVSAAYAVTGSRALRQSTKLGLTIHFIGGIVGMLIMLALAYLGSTELLTPTNVLLYQLIWAIPGLLVTEWTRTV